MPHFNGVGQMSPGFGAGQGLVNAIAAVAATNPAFWLDVNRGTLSPGGSVGTAQASLADYNYSGRNLTTYPLHNASQGTGANKPTLQQLPDNANCLGFGVTQGMSVATAFGASASHTFSFVYNPLNLNAANETIWNSDAAGGFIIYAKSNNSGGAGTTLTVFDTTNFYTLANLQLGVHSYIITIDAVASQTKVYIDSNPTAAATGGYSNHGAIGTTNTFGALNAFIQGLNGKCPNLIYHNSAISAPSIAAIAKYNKIQYGSG